MKCCNAQAFTWNTYGRERWAGEEGEGYVINADNRDVFRDLDARFFKSIHGSHGDKVASAKDYGGYLGSGENGLDCRSTGIQPVIGAGYRERANSPSFQARQQCLLNICCGAIGFGAGNDSSTVMAECGNMFDCLRYSMLIIDRDIADKFSRRAQVAEDHANARLDQIRCHAVVD